MGEARDQDVERSMQDKGGHYLAKHPKDDACSCLCSRTKKFQMDV